MSSAHSEGPSTRRPAKRQDRRDVTAPRLSYEAFVELGAGATGGFEAESVDLSLDGMRLRTAYLPEPGERMVCRFDGFGGEICAEAEVIWCHDAARGGEFGIRFTNLDERAMALLEDMCHPEDEDAEAPEPSDPSAAVPGARVRLHIQGLGSPMRARVRDSARDEVLIGSNLEFLRVGRSVELEDLERAATRVATIEHVAVEVDPETNIPQLVVALSYGGVRADEDARQPVQPAPVHHQEIDDDDLTTAPFQVRQKEQETTPEPTVIDSDPEPTPSIGHVPYSGRPRRVAQASAMSPAAPSVATRRSSFDDEDHPEHDPAVDTEAEAAEVSAAKLRVRERVGALARKLAPTLQAAGSGAKGALGRILQGVRERRARAQEQKAKTRAPKRTTAPPPSGALRNTGRRLVREQQPDPQLEAEATPIEPPKRERKRAVMGAVVGMMAVVGIYYASEHFRDGAEVTPDPARAVAAQGPQAPQANPAQQNAPIATAAVPLFGATPLSTTEPVPAPPAPGEAAAQQKGGEPGAGKAAIPANLEKEWGVGEVVDPIVLRLKMDGNIDGLIGHETATGFTVIVPGRKSISSAAGFKRKDKRLDTVNVVNYPDRAEITLLFKKDVPAFVARAKGKRVIIEIASAKKKGKKKKKKKKKGKKKK